MKTDASFALEERTFTQTYALRILLAVLLLSTAAFLLAWAANDDTHQSDKTLPGIAAGLVVVVVFLWGALARTRLTINAIGLHHESILGIQEISWTDIAETRYCISPVRLHGIGHAIAATMKSKPVNLTLRVIGSNGKELKITSNFRNAKDAIDIVLGRVLPPMVSDVRGRIGRGESVQFGQLMLSKSEIIWKGKTVIPVVEVERAELAGSKLRVKRAGKWLDAISVRSDKVPNVLVFLEVLEPVLRQHRALRRLQQYAKAK